MNGITRHDVENYMSGLVPPRDAVLAEMEDLAGRNRIPIIGPMVGTLCAQLARIHGAKRIFEMGSAIGYSTIWWARAVGAGGRVYYTDGSAENARQAETYLERAEVRDRVQILIGDALDLIDQIEGEFDIVFNDVDKEDYPRVFEKAAGRVRVGGLLVSDNALWYGRVADPNVIDPDTSGVRLFNKLLFSDPRYSASIVPLRDGIAIGLRVK